jgi:primosomal protein N' (replication factor Y)
MFVVEVIPLTPLPPNVPQLLSYFFDQEVAKGALVEAPIGTRKVPAIVVSCASLEQQKIALKKTGFQLKKLSSITNPDPLVSDIQLKITAWLSRHYYASLGMALKTVLPPFFSKKGYNVPTPEISNRIPGKPHLISVRAKDTLDVIKKQIKGVKGQILILTPEMELAAYYAKQIPDSVSLTSDTGAKDYKSIWAKVSGSSTKIACTTRVGLFLPFKNLELIILIDPNHEAYKSDMTPRYNTADLTRKVSELYHADLVMLTPQPSIEDEHEITHDRLTSKDLRPTSAPTPEIMNMVLEIRTGNFSLFAQSFQDALVDTVRNKQKMLLFSSRRAYSGVLMCSKCDLVFQCKNCHIPLRIHKTSETMLICYHCSAYHTAPTSCPNCSSKLKTSGIAGSQKIKEAVDALLAKHELVAPSLILDSDLTLNDKDETELLKHYADNPASILITTQMVFSHRHTLDFDFIGIPTADGFVTAPDFRNEERFLYQYQKLLDFNPKRIMLQTYHPESPVFASLASGDHKAFVEQELAARDILKYPPFAHLVKLSHKHRDQKKAFQNARILADKLTMAIKQLNLYDKVGIAGPSPATIARENNIFTYAIWMKISPDVERIDTILKYIPNGWIIDVDPSSTA